MLKTKEFALMLDNAWYMSQRANSHAEYKAYMTEYRRLLYGYKVSDVYCYPMDSYVDPYLLTRVDTLVTVEA